MRTSITRFAGIGRELVYIMEIWDGWHTGSPGMVYVQGCCKVIHCQQQQKHIFLYYTVGKVSKASHDQTEQCLRWSRISMTLVAHHYNRLNYSTFYLTSRHAGSVGPDNQCEKVG